MWTACVGLMMLALLFYTSSAAALMSLDHRDDTGGIARSIGETFTVEVIANYDGTPNVTSLFVSSGWDPTELELIEVTEAPFAIFAGPDGSLSRFGSVVDAFDDDIFGSDPEGTLRTVQFGAFPGELPGAGPETIITMLTFQVISAGDGIGEIGFIFNISDQIKGPDPCSLPNCFSPSEVELSGAMVTLVPEPGSVLLLGLGLVGLSARRRSN